MITSDTANPLHPFFVENGRESQSSEGSFSSLSTVTEEKTKSVFNRSINYLKDCVSYIKTACHYFYEHPASFFTYIPNSIYIFFYGDGTAPSSFSIHTQDIFSILGVSRMSQVSDAILKTQAEEAAEIEKTFGPNITTTDEEEDEEQFFDPLPTDIERDRTSLRSSMEDIDLSE